MSDEEKTYRKYERFNRGPVIPKRPAILVHEFREGVCCKHDWSKGYTDKDGQEYKVCSACDARAIFEDNQIVEYDASAGLVLTDAPKFKPFRKDDRERSGRDQGSP